LKKSHYARLQEIDPTLAESSLLDLAPVAINQDTKGVYAHGKQGSSFLCGDKFFGVHNFNSHSIKGFDNTSRKD
jgi:hypothetical protein